MARDIAIASMRGTLWSYTTTDGLTRYPMAAYSKVSASLDVLAQIPGALLFRGADLWTYLAPSLVDGRVLTWSDALQQPTWADPVATANYSPPSVATFPTIIGTPAATTAQAPSGPLVLRRAVAGAGTTLAAAVRPLGATPRTYTFGLRVAAQAVGNRRFGIVVRDSATDRCLACVFVWILTSSVPRLNVEQWTTTAIFNAPVFNRDFTTTTPVFLRLHDDGVNFRFDYSADDANWATLTTVQRNAWCANPDQVGFGIGSAATETIESTLAAIHYVEA